MPPSVRRLIVDLKAEYPGFNPNEIANACCVRFGRRPARKTVKRVLSEEPTPLRFVRRFASYHDIPEPAERRRAVVALHTEGLELWPTLRHELLNFRRKQNKVTAHISYEHWRESEHDDMVLAAALACWKATYKTKGTTKLRVIR